MSNHNLVLQSKFIRHKEDYRKDGDTTRYTVKNLTAAVDWYIEEKNAGLRRMGKPGLAVPAVLSLGSPILMAAIDTVEHAIHCPVDHEMSAEEFLHHFGRQIQKRYDREYAEPARNALGAVEDALRKVGILK